MVRKTYTREFKLKVVQAVEAAELRPAQACREYQIAESVLNRLRHEVRLRGTDAAFTPLATPSATPDYEARIAELERVWSTRCGECRLKKGLAACSVQVRHDLMSSLHQEFPSLSVRQLCTLLGVSRSWVYRRSHAPSQAERDVALREAIEQIVLEFPGYGYRRVTAELQRQHWTANHKHVLRIMRQEALLCQLKRNWIATTDSRHGLQTYPNLLAGLAVEQPNQAWVADITYIRLPSAFVYLACVLGCLVAALYRLAALANHRYPANAGRPQPCDRSSSAHGRADPLFRSRRAVCERQLYGTPAWNWRPHQHVGQGQPV